MAVKIIQHGKRPENAKLCPESRSTDTQAIKNNQHECKACSCQWQEIESNNPNICESCGKTVNRRCDDCGWVYGRRGWRQLGVYDG